MSASSCFHGGMFPAGQALPILPRSHSGPLQRDWGAGSLQCSRTAPEQGFQNTWPGWELSLTSSHYLLPPHPHQPTFSRTFSLWPRTHLFVLQCFF